MVRKPTSFASPDAGEATSLQLPVFFPVNTNCLIASLLSQRANRLVPIKPETAGCDDADHRKNERSSMMAPTPSSVIQAKLVLLGDMGAGKTSIVVRFAKGLYYECQESTIGAAFFSQALPVSGRGGERDATVRFDIWDTAGQERYHSLAPMYYRGAAAAAIVYDITNTDSYIRAKKWVDELHRQGNPHLVMALVGNKVDLEEKRKVGTQEALEYAERNGLFFVETSAKTAQNVGELFYELAERLVKVRPNRPAGMVLHERRGAGGRWFCCSG